MYPILFSLSFQLKEKRMEWKLHFPLSMEVRILGIEDMGYYITIITERKNPSLQSEQ